MPFDEMSICEGDEENIRNGLREELRRGERNSGISKQYNQNVISRSRFTFGNYTRGIFFSGRILARVHTVCTTRHSIRRTNAHHTPPVGTSSDEFIGPPPQSAAERKHAARNIIMMSSSVHIIYVRVIKRITRALLIAL